MVPLPRGGWRSFGCITTGEEGRTEGRKETRHRSRDSGREEDSCFRFCFSTCTRETDSCQRGLGDQKESRIKSEIRDYILKFHFSVRDDGAPHGPSSRTAVYRKLGLKQYVKK